MKSLQRAAWALSLGLLWALGARTVFAEDAPAKEATRDHPWKLSTGVYALAGGGQPSAQALDVNLRRTSTWGNAWLGGYQQSSGDLNQWRAGWDQVFHAGAVRVQPSLQAASGGFRGASLYVEAGKTWFAGVGAGRTNLRPYVNLNFDPNDMLMLALGHRRAGTQLQAQLVADNRQNPDQRHLHLNWRQDLGGGERLTWDLLLKRGKVDGELIQRAGASLTYDWPRWSVRAAWDPKVNFTAQNMLRVSVATRF